MKIGYLDKQGQGLKISVVYISLKNIYLDGMPWRSLCELFYESELNRVQLPKLFRTSDPSGRLQQLWTNLHQFGPREGTNRGECGQLLTCDQFCRERKFPQRAPFLLVGSLHPFNQLLRSLFFQLTHFNRDLKSDIRRKSPPFRVLHRRPFWHWTAGTQYPCSENMSYLPV